MFCITYLQGSPELNTALGGPKLNTPLFQETLIVKIMKGRELK